MRATPATLAITIPAIVPAGRGLGEAVDDGVVVEEDVDVGFAPLPVMIAVVVALALVESLKMLFSAALSHLTGYGDVLEL